MQNHREVQKTCEAIIQKGAAALQQAVHCSSAVVCLQRLQPHRQARAILQDEIWGAGQAAYTVPAVLSRTARFTGGARFTAPRDTARSSGEHARRVCHPGVHEATSISASALESTTHYSFCTVPKRMEGHEWEGWQGTARCIVDDADPMLLAMQPPSSSKLRRSVSLTTFVICV